MIIDIKVLRFNNSAFMAEKLRRLKLENDFNKWESSQKIKSAIFQQYKC